MRPLPFQGLQELPVKVHGSYNIRSLRVVNDSRCKVPRHRHSRTSLHCTRRQSRLIRCHAGKPPGGLKRFLKWGQKVLESLMTENKAAHDLLGSVDPPAIASTPERPTPNSSSPSKASKTQLKSQIPVPESPEASIPITSDDKPTAVESKSIPVERRLSTISLYDKEHADSKEPKTRSSIGRDSVRLNAKARVPSLKNQKAGFDKTIGFTAKKERAEKELKRRKKAYYHLSTKEDHEITADWPSPEEKTWEQWKEMFDATSKAEAEFVDARVNAATLAEHDEFDLARDVMHSVPAIEEKDNLRHIIKAFRKALAEEDYETAMHLRDEGGLGLVGWWFASSCNARGNTPHLLRVSPGYNRLVFEAFTPSELAQEFEVFPQSTDQPPVMIGTLGERLPDLDRIDLFNALVAQRRNEYQNRDKGSTIEVGLDPESGPNEERPEDSGNEESETEIDSTEEITVAELHYLGVDPKLESHKRLGSEFRKQAFAFQKHIPPDSDLRKLHPVFSLENEIETPVAQTDSRVSLQGSRSSFQQRSSMTEDLKDRKLKDALSTFEESESKIDPQSSTDTVSPDSNEDNAETSTEVAVVPSSTGASAADAIGDTAAAIQRKDELLKSIQMHHRIDTESDVPILHIFLTAKQEPLKAYKDAQQGQLQQRKDPGDSENKQQSELPPQFDIITVSEPGLESDGSLERKTIFACNVSLSVQRVPADIIKFPDDPNRFMIKVFPDPLLNTIEDKCRSVLKKQAKSSPQAGAPKVPQQQSSPKVLFEIQEEVQAVVKQFAEANGFDPSEIEVDLAQTLKDTGILFSDNGQSQFSAEGSDSVPFVAQMQEAPYYDRLQGTTSYKRLPQGLPKTDPLSGFFVRGTGEYHMVDVLLLERVKEGKKEFVVAKLLTFEDTNENGRVVFKAEITRNKKLDTQWHPYPFWNVEARYKAEVLAEDGITWTDGVELLQLSSTKFPGIEEPSPSLIIMGSSGYTTFMLYRLPLDDPWGDSIYESQKSDDY